MRNLTQEEYLKSVHIEKIERKKELINFHQYMLIIEIFMLTLFNIMISIFMPNVDITTKICSIVVLILLYQSIINKIRVVI